MEVLTLLLVPATNSAWTLSDKGEILHAGEVELLDFGVFLDGLIRTVHRAGRRLRIVVKVSDSADDFGLLVAVATIRRVAGIYDAVTLEGIS